MDERYLGRKRVNEKETGGVRYVRELMYQMYVCEENYKSVDLFVLDQYQDDRKINR